MPIYSRTKITRYHVEIRHPGHNRWNHIHHPNWETTGSITKAEAYREAVAADHPGAETRIATTTAVRLVDPHGH